MRIGITGAARVIVCTGIVVVVNDVAKWYG